MKHKITIIALATLLFLFAHPLKAAITMNDIVRVFPDIDGNSIEDNVIDGASNFLSSYSNALMASNSESSSSYNNEENHTTSLNQIETAKEVLIKSKLAYENALELGRKSEYIFFFQDKLKNFNYQRCIQELALDQNLADEVVYFLRAGNVLGLYKKNIENIDEILNTLEFIQEQLKANTPASESVYSKLYRQYHYAGLFGNYSTLLGGKALEGE